MRGKTERFKLIDGQEAASAAPTAVLPSNTATMLKPDTQAQPSTPKVGAVEASPEPSKADQIALARMKGYEGENCGECGNFTMVRNGTCLKCDTCGATSGCS